MSWPASETLSHSDGWVHAPDGLRLYWQSWQPEGPRGAVLIVHGLAEHSGRYAEMARDLARAGYACYALDYRGHGKSPGLRVHVDSFDEFLGDVATGRRLAAERHPDLPNILLGHSQGGLIALLSALREPGDLSTLVLTSPLLAPHADTRLPRPLHLLALGLARLWPRLRLKSTVDPRWISRDGAVVAAYVDDPLVSDRISVGWYSALQAALREAWSRAGELTLPTLIMPAHDDRLVDPSAAAQWAERAPANLVTLIPWPGLYHEILNEPEREQVLTHLKEWLERAIGGSPAKT